MGSKTAADEMVGRTADETTSMTKSDGKTVSKKTDETASKTAERDMTESGMMGNEKASGMTDEMCDMNDLMAELSEDELAELAELEEIEVLAELDDLDELDEFEAMWHEEDRDEGSRQEGVPTSDGETDSPDGGQGETSRTEETEQADKAEDPYDQIVDGYIYLITNLVNGKKYVGQTTKTIEWRWKSHVSDSHSDRKPWKSLIDRAILKYGEDNFQVEEIEHIVQQPRKILDQREIYWIREYKTCIKMFGRSAGYNVSRGGHSSLLRLSLSDEQEIVRMYNNNVPIIDIAKQYSVSPHTIASIRDKYHLPSRSGEQQKAFFQSLRGMTIIGYTDTKIFSFPSSREAARWVIEQGYSSGSNIGGIAAALRLAAAKGTSMYGLKWQLPDATEEYLKQLTLQDAKLRQKKTKKCSISQSYKTSVCTICGVAICSDSTYCRQHMHKHKVFNTKNKQIEYIHNDIQRDSIYVPFLGNYPLSYSGSLLLLRFYNLTEIGLMYGVSSNRVKQFLKKNYSIEITQHNLIRIWNYTYNCYEYTDSLIWSFEELSQKLSSGESLNTLSQFLKISKTSLLRYLNLQFGENSVQQLLSATNQTRKLISILDLTTQVQTETIAEMARYLIATVPEATTETPKNFTRRIWRHLIKSQETTYSCYGHELIICESHV